MRHNAGGAMGQARRHRSWSGEKLEGGRSLRGGGAGGRAGLGPRGSEAGSSEAVIHGCHLFLLLLQTWLTASLCLSPSASTRS